MKRFAPLLFALPLLIVPPVMGQDFLGSFEDFVETLTGPPPASKPVPKATAPAVAAEAEAEVSDPPPVPRPRPEGLGEEAPDAEPVEVEPPEASPSEAEEDNPSSAPAGHLLPQGEKEEDPARIYQGACPAVIAGLVEAEMTPPLSEGVCGERSPLTVTAVLVRGRMVPLSSPVVTNCAMASALPGWLDTVDGYADAMLESPLAEVQTGTSYMCRAVVGGDSGRLSEHGFANAVDVVGFTLEDGRSVAVEGDWMPATAPEGRLLRLAHDAACSGFTTVLGPEANAEHEDHLHLDLGCHGQTCTARICE